MKRVIQKEVTTDEGEPMNRDDIQKMIVELIQLGMDVETISYFVSAAIIRGKNEI